jgi:hypothetical protein
MGLVRDGTPCGDNLVRNAAVIQGGLYLTSYFWNQYCAGWKTRVVDKSVSVAYH